MGAKLVYISKRKCERMQKEEGVLLGRLKQKKSQYNNKKIVNLMICQHKGILVGSRK